MSARIESDGESVTFACPGPVSKRAYRAISALFTVGDRVHRTKQPWRVGTVVQIWPDSARIKVRWTVNGQTHHSTLRAENLRQADMSATGRFLASEALYQWRARTWYRSGGARNEARKNEDLRKAAECRRLAEESKR